MATLYLFPTEFEAAPFKALAPLAEVRIVGVGMAQTAAALSRVLATEHPQRVVLCGIAGACDERLEVEQVVEVVEDIEMGLPERYNITYTPQRYSSLPAVRAYTVSRCGATLEWSKGARGEEESLPTIEQMEGAAVGALCREWGVEYSHLRAISNRVGDSREQWRAVEAAQGLARMLAEEFRG